MEFSRQEYWNGLPFPSPRDLPKPGIEAGSPALQADALLSALLSWIKNQALRKSERERQIPYDITYMWNLNCDTNESRKRK